MRFGDGLLLSKVLFLCFTFTNFKNWRPKSNDFKVSERLDLALSKKRLLFGISQHFHQHFLNQFYALEENKPSPMATQGLDASREEQ